MQKAITVCLVFLAGFCLSFNVIRNLAQHRNAFETNQEEPLAHSSFHSASVKKHQDQNFKTVQYEHPEELTESVTNLEEQQEEDIGTPPAPDSVAEQPQDDLTKSADASCHAEAQAEYWGDVVKFGVNNIKKDAGECCEDCKNFPVTAENPDGCNTWVFCPAKEGCGGGGPFGACWLKYQPHPEAPAVNRGKDIPWTSGSLFQDRELTKSTPGKSRKFHTVMTTNGSVYVNWQSQIMYYFFKKFKALQGPDGDMGGFTRLLHGEPDALMDEIPTVVVERLNKEYGFVVLSRPNAFVQWLNKVEIEEDYILMAEPDHIILRPIPNLMVGDKAAAFPFFYIAPKEFPDLIQKYVGPIGKRNVAKMDPVGNSPVMIHKNDLKKVAPTWADLAVKMKTDPEADKAWGWVLEMWAYTCAAQIEGVKHDLIPKLAAQPPWDQTLDGFYILHYTYGNDFNEKGVFTPGKFGAWRFDKRSYMSRYPNKYFELPPKGTFPSVRNLIEFMNEGMGNLTNWDDMAKAHRNGGRPRKNVL
mmetsp:Transcript_19465/g.23299  ORF Transcript_19465/g.23299 Transcript_19465/m.23299 type:complete len:528 (-) Transcript_19465:155-1738(-)|eukprot:CAMPEP_0197850126 /NCGR_PEP_ID=MMETSP1438-20131217/14284_1 /TAXON_ID=1461541 /ORGANISM="Pterosperma sp., Strain CCMP1384" /LENGTH=527 /DNA_ID=CAMNT_0043463109 /DNA_START=270 /DNA_END=1853 /DNA_ORIENTATION=-